MEINEFIKVSESLDETVKEIDLSNKSFDRRDSGVEISGVGTLSKRALSHLARHSGVPASLIKDMTLSTMNTSIKEQFIRRSLSTFRLGFNPTKPSEIVFIQPVSEPFLRYSDVLDPISKTIFKINGDPITDDHAAIFTKNYEISPEGDNLMIGQLIKFSPLNTRPLTSDMMAYRLICSNGAISTSYTQKVRLSIENASPKFVSEIISARSKDCDEFAASFGDFVRNTSQKAIPELPEIVMEDALRTKLVPSRVIKQSLITASSLKAGETSLNTVGIPHLDNLWMYVNLFTFICQQFTQWAVVEAAQKGAYSWAEQKLQGSLI